MNSTRSTSSRLPQGDQHHPFPPEYNLSRVISQAVELRNRLRPRWSSLIAIVVITAITIVGTIIWVLDILGILHLSWTAVIGAVLSAISILLALWPLDAQTVRQGKDQPMNSADAPDTSPRKVSLWTRRKRGILHVKVKERLRHTTIALYHGFNQALDQAEAATSISEWLVEGEIMYIGTFPSLKPGNYTVATQDKEHIAMVTIYAGVTSWIDWR